MRKLVGIGLAALAVGAIGLVGAPAASAASNLCIERSTDGERVACTATTAARGADFARVKMGRYTVGLWALRCSSGNRTTFQRGSLGRNGSRVIPVTLRGNPTCLLRARGTSRRRAAVRVSLF